MTRRTRTMCCREVREIFSLDIKQDGVQLYKRNACTLLHEKWCAFKFVYNFTFKWFTITLQNWPQLSIVIPTCIGYFQNQLSVRSPRPVSLKKPFFCPLYLPRRYYRCRTSKYLLQTIIAVCLTNHLFPPLDAWLFTTDRSRDVKLQSNACYCYCSQA